MTQLFCVSEKLISCPFLLLEMSTKRKAVDRYVKLMGNVSSVIPLA